jgi:spore coat polysaccharide biosynthesis protein SpsF
MKTAHKVLAILQARMSSTRLPGKVLKEVNGTPLLAYELARLKLVGGIDTLVVATSTNPEDEAIETLCRSLRVDCFRGSLNDVLFRYAECARQYPDHEIIVRVTGDCPLIDPRLVERLVTLFKEGGYDYASNMNSESESFPEGMDAEVFSRKVLFETEINARMQSDHEHVTPHIRNNMNYRKGKITAQKDYSQYRLTVDQPEDFEVVKFLIEHCSPDAGYLDYVALLDDHPEVLALNTHIMRNEGMLKSLKNDAEIK